MEVQFVVLPTLQIEDLATVNGSSHVVVAEDQGVDEDQDPILEVRVIKRAMKIVYNLHSHLVDTGQGAGAEAADMEVTIAGHIVVAHKEAITSKVMVKECADEVVHQGAFSTEITVAAEGADALVHKMARVRQNTAVKKVPVDPHVQDIVDVEPCVRVEIIHKRNLKIRLKIPLHLLNLMRVNLCRIQQLKVLHKVLSLLQP